MSELVEKVKTSIERIKAFNPLGKTAIFDRDKPYFVAFSGGKDSVVLKALMDMAGVPYEAHYRITSVDPPELVKFIKEKHPDVKRDYPLYTEYGKGAYRGEEWVGKAITMWNLIPWKLMPPTRIARYCCDYLKESAGDGRMTVTGVRWAESARRAKKQGIATVYGSGARKEFADNPYFRVTGNNGAVLVNDNAKSRQMVDACVTRHKTCLNPIIDWTDNDVWEFIRAEKIPYCELYDCGFKRLGCIGCPMASKTRLKEFATWPKYKAAYLRAFGKMLKEREARHKETRSWNSANDVFHFWMQDGVLPGQEMLEGFED